MSQNLSSAAVVIGALRVKYENQEGYGETVCMRRLAWAFVARVNMRGYRKFVQRESNFNHFFLFWWGRKDPNTTIRRSSSAHQRNAILLAFRWRADGGPTLNAYLVALWF